MRLKQIMRGAQAAIWRKVEGGKTYVEVAKGAGWSKVHRLTHETNTNAMKLYDRIASRSGFVQYRQVF